MVDRRILKWRQYEKIKACIESSNTRQHWDQCWTLLDTFYYRWQDWSAWKILSDKHDNKLKDCLTNK